MKKADLKTGMQIHFKNGNVVHVLLNTKNGDIAAGVSWFPLEDCANNLNDWVYDGGVLCVKNPHSNMDFLKERNSDVVWTRPEPKPIKPEPIKFSIDLKASDKGERKKAVKYLRGKGFEVKKRKDEICTYFNFLASVWCGIEYYEGHQWSCDVSLLTLPADWDRFVEIVDNNIKAR